MRKVIFLDFEYSESPDRVSKRLVCVSIKVGQGEVDSFDLTNPVEVAQFKELITLLHNPDKYIFSAFAMDAEFNSLLHLGLNLYDMDWIDWAVEAKMIMMTLRGYLSKKYSLLEACSKFKVVHRHAEDKEGMRDIILQNETYSSEQMVSIIDYCESDVEALAELAKAITGLIKRVKIAHRINRGHFCKAVSLAMFNTKGLPIDKHFLDTVYNNKADILEGLYLEVNNLSKQDIYRQDKKGGWHFTQKEFEAYLVSAGLWEVWTKTTTGRGSKKEEVLDKFISNNKNYPVIAALYTSSNTVRSLSSTDYRSILSKDGYVKPLSIPFNQVTGRSSPKPKNGFALNLQPWMRLMVKPKEGMCLVAADWGKQEIAIAAALSGDVNYTADYYSDIYLENAKLCGIVPPDGTKEDYAEVRQKFKSIVLGMGYGKMEASVARDLELIFNLPKDEALNYAANLFIMRAERYPDYFEWIEATITDSRLNRVYSTIDNWLYFVDRLTKKTQLQNLPMQSNGAAIMRRGFIRAVEAGLDVVCSLHDALYINCREETVERDSARLIECMSLAVKDILGEEITIDNEIKVITARGRLKDSQGRDAPVIALLSKYVQSFAEFA